MQTHTSKRGAAPEPKSAALEGELIPKVDLRQYKIQVTDTGGRRRTISPLDVAAEAVEVQKSFEGWAEKEREFSGHMLQLAAKCETPAEFNALCESVVTAMSWGKQNPAPKRWIVYRSTILRNWADFGIKPFEEIEAPKVIGGQLALKDGHPVIEAQVPQGINQIKRIAKGLKLQRASVHPAQRATATPRDFARVLSAQLDPQAGEIFRKLLTVYLGVKAGERPKVLARVERVVRAFEKRSGSTAPSPHTAH